MEHPAVFVRGPAAVLRGLVHEWFDVRGLDVRPSFCWVKELFRAMCLSYKPAKCVKEVHSPEQQHDNTHLKLCWPMDKHAVSGNRVVDIDETSSRLLPVHLIGWGRRGVKQAQLHGNAKEATTFTVAFSMVAGAHSSRHVRERLGHHDHDRATHALDEPGKEGQVWILLWDMASIHASEVTQATVKANSTSRATWPSSAASRDAGNHDTGQPCRRQQLNGRRAPPWTSAAKILVWSTGWRQLRARSDDVPRGG